MIIGTLMALETCLILGQVSHNLLYSTEKFPMDICVPVKAANIQAKSFMARTLDEIGKKCRPE